VQSACDKQQGRAIHDSIGDAARARAWAHYGQNASGARNGSHAQCLRQAVVPGQRIFLSGHVLVALEDAQGQRLPMDVEVDLYPQDRRDTRRYTLRVQGGHVNLQYHHMDPDGSEWHVAGVRVLHARCTAAVCALVDRAEVEALYLPGTPLVLSPPSQPPIRPRF
jgi:hypothetical protein